MGAVPDKREPVEEVGFGSDGLLRQSFRVGNFPLQDFGHEADRSCR